jgi:hypothetical protein
MTHIPLQTVLDICTTRRNHYKSKLKTADYFGGRLSNSDLLEHTIEAIRWLRGEIRNAADTPPTTQGPIAHLSDRDLMANLWFHIHVAMDEFGYDPDTTEQSLVSIYRDTAGASTTLTAMLAEVETRLGITATAETTMDRTT